MFTECKMGYNIEVSFNILKNRNTTEMEKEIISIAVDNSCSHYYNTYEMENTRIPRNHCVFTTHFDEMKIEQMLNFLRTIKKRKGIYIECIYDENTNNLIYASTYYLSAMKKECAVDYKERKRARSYSEEEIEILNEVKQKK